MQTSRRFNTTVMQPIEIRKSVLINQAQNLSTTSMQSPNNPQQNNDTLSPNVAPNINPFDESLTKSIQEQLNQTASSTEQPNNSNHNNTNNSPTTRSTSQFINNSQLTSSNVPAFNRSISIQHQQHIIPINNSINLKKSKTIGNYILFDVLTTTASTTTTQNDLMYNIALNLNDKKSYYWKKVSAGCYTKKLQPYFLMESSEHVYRFHELIVDANDAYIFFQSHHGDLHSYMKEKKRLKESEAKSLFYQIVEVVRECHENGIIVRDIKLKKFVFADAEKKRILLTNLEDCLVLDDEDNDLIKSQQGCPAYVSPEVLNPAQTHYSGKLSDSWSLGIVLYTLLFGRYPFHHNVITTMFAKITKGKFAIPTNGISIDAKILLRSLIRLNASERLLPNEIVKTNWFKDFSFIDYKNVYEVNRVINDVKKSHSNNRSNNSNSSFETVNYFAELIESNASNLVSARNSITIDDQSVPL